MDSDRSRASSLVSDKTCDRRRSKRLMLCGAKVQPPCKSRGAHTSMESHLHDESALTRVLDVSDGSEEATDVEVVPELVVLRKVELARSEGVDDPFSPW
jgi:hypothetical protein